MRKLILLFSVFSTLLAAAQQKPLVNSGEAIREGNELHRNGEYKKAIEKYLIVSPNDTNYYLMLHELALAYVADSQFDAAIPICEEGLSQLSGYEEYYYSTLGSAYNKRGDLEKAVEVYREGLKKFPYSHRLQYNIGFAYYSKNRFSEAFEELLKVFDNNPWDNNTHSLLAMIALRQGHTTHAMLSMSSALLVNPDAANSKQMISLLESLSNNEELIKPDEKVKPFQENGDFDELDELIRSKIALNKEYKAEVKIDAALSKQLQLVFEKLEFNSKSNDYWMKMYVPIFRRLAEKQLLQPFVYSILSSLKLPEVEVWVKKNDDKIKLLYTMLAEDLNKMRETKTITESGKPKTYSSWYSEGRLAALGNLVGDDANKKTGYWRFYYDNGTLSSEGQFGSTFKKTGNWIYYDKTGRKTYEITFANDVEQGPFRQYHQNGALRLEANSVAGKFSGEVKFYYKCGAIKEQITYAAGVKSGKAKSFFASGQVQSEYSYKEGEVNGPFTIYFPSGAKEATGTYKLGKRDGAYKEFYEDGKLSESGSYIEGSQSGIWKFYHPNEKIASEINFGEGGKFNGLVKRYYANGNQRNEENYSSGVLHGESKYFEEDGKLHYRMEYKKGKVIALEYFDKTGKSISKSTISSGEIAVKTFYPEGQLSGEGKYKGGDIQGEWKEYYRSGVLKNIENYKDGMEQGKYTAYHTNGKLNVEATMKDNQVDGYYRSFHANGKPQSEGWMVSGQRQGDWFYYYETGKLARTAYYLDGETIGTDKEFTPTEKLLGETRYDDGQMVAYTRYDSTGAELSSAKWAAGTGEEVRKYRGGDTLFAAAVLCGEYHGKVKWYYPGGKLKTEINLQLGERHGNYTEYYESGKPKHEAKYHYGDATGKWFWYYENGKVNTVGNYKNDGRDSIWFWYYEDEKTDAIISYRNDEREGLAIYYVESGELLYQKHYADDIQYYQYMEQSGQLSAPQYLKNSTGKVLTYYKNGQKSAEEEYVNGYFEGPRLEFFPNGNPRVKAFFKDSKLEGAYIEYYSNGKVKMEENYFHGKKHGVCNYYREDGSKEKTARYMLDDRYGKEEHFDKTGKLVKTIEYYDDNALN